MAERVFDENVAVYVYKCLLRRKQALLYLRPINDELMTSFDTALNTVVDMIPADIVKDADKQMRVCQESELSIYIDASVKDNDRPDLPSQASVSFVIQSDGAEVYSKGYYIGTTVAVKVSDKPITLDVTGNVAEYIALIKLLEFMVDNEYRGKMVIHSDSQLVVNQMNGTSSTRSSRLLILRDYARRLMSRLPNAELVHITREQNTCADALAKAVITGNEHLKILG